MMRKYVLAFYLISFSFSVSAQVAQGGEPFRWADKSILSDIPVVTTQAPDLDILAAEDAVTDQYKEVPYRFGVEIAAHYNLENSGRWLIDPQSPDAVWQLGVECEGATSVSFVLSRFNIPDNARLFVWNEDRSEFLGSFTSANMNEELTLGLGILQGQRVYLEYSVPVDAQNWGELEVGTIVHGYRDILASHFDAERGPYGNSGACNINVNCPEGAGWQVEKRSVALIVQGGNALCSGALVNNTTQDGTPYFLTANHCLGGSVNNWVFYFNHEAATCGGNTGPTNQSVSGATLRASNSGSDFALLELNNIPPTSYNVYYAGWDNSDQASANTAAVGIHHPSGDVKKICFENDSPSQNNVQGAQVWYIDEWESGVTEGGSSGSPLFNQSKRIIGQLYGGYAACSGQVNNGEADWYGRFGVSWDNGTTNSTRLSNWLDPLNLGVTTLDGFSGETYALDAVAAGVSGIPESVCGSSGIPSFTLRNNGSDALTEAVITVTYNGEVITTIQWEGNLAQNEQEVIELPEMTFVDGDNTIQIEVSDPNGGADEAAGNNTLTFNFSAFVGETTEITVSIEFDFYPEETAWELLNENGVTVASSNGFYASQPMLGSLEITECVPYGCYSFVMIDDYGDGMCGFGVCGEYVVTDSEGNVLAEGDGDFEDEETTDFCLENSTRVENSTEPGLSVFPNPARDLIRVEGMKTPSRVEILDITGSVIYAVNAVSSLVFDAKNLADGVYFFRVTGDGYTSTRKVIVRK